MADLPPHTDRITMDWTPHRMLARLDGDTELAVQLAAIFIDEYPRMLERLRAAVTAGSADERAARGACVERLGLELHRRGTDGDGLRARDDGTQRSARRNAVDLDRLEQEDRGADRVPAGFSREGDRV